VDAEFDQLDGAGVGPWFYGAKVCSNVMRMLLEPSNAQDAAGAATTECSTGHSHDARRCFSQSGRSGGENVSSLSSP